MSEKEKDIPLPPTIFKDTILLSVGQPVRVILDKPLSTFGQQISGNSFDWIEDDSYHGNKGSDIGVIAQEIEEILPEIVQTRDSGMKAVKYEKIIPLLIEAIKDQQKQIEDQQKQIDELKTKLK